MVAFAAMPSPAEAAFPGQNGKIAFERVGAADSLQVWTMNADGSDETPLTTGQDLAREPQWSPDGTKIAYTSRPRADHQLQHVRIMNADGTGDHQAIPAWSYSPTWSPDGERLAFVAPRFDGIECSCLVYEIVEADLDGSNRRVIAAGKYDPNTGHLGPVSRMEWSPDGDEIVIQDGDFDLAEVVALNVATGAKRHLAGDPYCCNTAWPGGWSPDASKVAFILDGFEPNDLAIYTIERGGGGLAEVTGPNAPFAVEWSPDGTRLVFKDSPGFPDEGGIYVADVDGSAMTRLTTGADQEPDWQPIPAPQRSDYKNAVQFCKAEREFFGNEAFRQRYGGGANAHGKCVSGSRLLEPAASVFKVSYVSSRSRSRPPS